MPTKTTRPSEDFHNPYGYSDMDWAAQLDPAYAAARAEVRRLSVGEDGTLSVKVKEFVVMGVLASRGLQYGGPGTPGPRTRWSFSTTQPAASRDARQRRGGDHVDRRRADAREQQRQPERKLDAQ